MPRIHRVEAKNEILLRPAVFHTGVHCSTLNLYTFREGIERL